MAGEGEEIIETMIFARSIWTLEIDSKPTLAFEARKYREADEIRHQKSSSLRPRTTFELGCEIRFNFRLLELDREFLPQRHVRRLHHLEYLSGQHSLREHARFVL